MAAKLPCTCGPYGICAADCPNRTGTLALTLQQALAGFPAVLITGISKGGFASGAGNLLVPLMALSVPAPIAAGIALPLLCAMDVSGLRAWWGKWDKREMRVLIPGAVAGILAGRLVFSMVHKWNFLFPIGRLGLNMVVGSFVLALIIFMAVLGLRMDLKGRLRRRRIGDLQE